jgi:subtilase family serine protease
MWRRAPLTLVCAGALGAARIVTAGLQVANASSGRTALRGTAAPARARAHRVGSVSNSARESFQLVLKLRNASGAAALLRTVSTPGSRSYRHYLRTAQWVARFSPTNAEIARATRWLRGEGFNVGRVSRTA